MPGIAVSSYWLDGTKPGEPSQECDFVLITPQLTAAVEVKGTHPDITFGTITAHENGPWRHDVLPVDPVRTREKDDNPFRQVRGCAYRLKHLIASNGMLSRPWVSGVVIVVPPMRSEVSRRVASKPQGCTAVIGNRGIREWLHSQSGRRPIWTAEKAHALLTAMNLGEASSIPDLVSEGFRSDSTTSPSTSSGRPVARPVRTSTVPPPVRTSTATVSPEVPSRRRTVAAPEPQPAGWASGADTLPSTPRPARRTRAIAPRSGVQAAAALALIAAIGCGVWIMSRAGDSEPRRTGDQQVILPSTEQMVPAPPPAPLSESVPGPPAPAPESGCFPFQANC
ncbi:nuclease-related domain-containing protein [Nocardia takedensis]|uniref:nuclease-related domain-containing protein n=1 Tax=Nocardia takedensis TaxID=259390 RepID=UPI003570A772